MQFNQNFFHFLSISFKYFSQHPVLKKSRDNSVDTETSYGLDDWIIGVRFPSGAGNFSL
jgi:hypothetical protein